MFINFNNAHINKKSHTYKCERDPNEKMNKWLNEFMGVGGGGG